MTHEETAAVPFVVSLQERLEAKFRHGYTSDEAIVLADLLVSDLEHTLEVYGDEIMSCVHGVMNPKELADHVESVAEVFNDAMNAFLDNCGADPQKLAEDDGDREYQRMKEGGLGQ